MLRPRQSKKDLVALGAEKLLSAYIFESVAPVVKTFGRFMRENISVGSHLCFGHLSCKKMRSPDYFALVAPVRKTFGRASRKNYGRWSVLFRSRQSLKRFRQWSHVLLFGPVKTKLRSADTCASSAPVKRRFGRARRRKTSVGVHFCIGRASRKNFWSRHARKHFGRQPFVLRSPQLQKNAVPGLF